MDHALNFFIAFVAAVAGPIALAIWDWMHARYAYILKADGQPLRHGSAMNTLGRKVRVDKDGRFKVPKCWHHGSRLLVYDEMGELLGEARLQEEPGRQFAIIRLGNKGSPASA
jgi:hypothetical protein